MNQIQVNERPRWITMKVPVLRHTIKVPKKISKLVYQLNIRGFRTSNIVWGDPIFIELNSYTDFIEKVKQSGKHEKREVRDFYKFLIEEIDFKLNIHKFQADIHDPVIISIVLPHAKIEKFETLFYNGFIRRESNTNKETIKHLKIYDNQALDDQISDDERVP